MKRWIIFIIMFCIFLASIGIGYFYLNTRTDQKIESKASDEYIYKTDNEIKNEKINTKTEVEEKISPNAHITRIIFYKKCGHEIIETEIAQEKFINMTIDEFKEEIAKENYKIENFSNLEISIYKQEDGICPEHYIIGEEDGIINIYKIDEYGETKLYDITNIYIEYLPEDEREKIKNKIEFVGKEELNLFLENLES